MSSAEHVFDVVILAPVEGELPKLIYRAQSIVAKDEDAAKVKAIDEARACLPRGVKLDLDAIAVLVTRPFEDEDMVLVTWPGYVAPQEYKPLLPRYAPSWYWPPVTPWYCNSKSTTDVKVTVGSTLVAAPKEA